MSVTINLTQLKRKKRKDGTIPVYIRITEDRKSRYKSTGISILPKYWNPEKKEVRRSHRRSGVLNSELGKKLRMVRDKKYELQKKDKLSMDALRQTITKNKNPQSILNQANIYREYLDRENRYWEHRHYKVIIGNLEKFISIRKKNDHAGSG